jgi:tetratricopeptide (TPR) repeat protein
MTSPDDRRADAPLPQDPQSTGQDDADSLVISLPDESSEPKDLWLWAGVLVILTLVAYWPITDGAFISQDEKHVSANQLLARPDGMAVAWTKRWESAKDYPLPQYHPMAFTSYWLDYRLFGHDAQTKLPTPFVYHLSNIIYHAAAAVLLWLVLRKLKLPGAWLAAAVFALHPINTEAVAWISQRGTVLCGALFFGSIYTYLLFAEEAERAHADGVRVDPVKEWGLYAGSLLLFVLGMLAKSPAFAMPFVTALLLWWRRRFSARHLMLLAPFAIIGLVLAFNAADFERDIGRANGPDYDLGTASRFVIAGRAVWFYIGKLLLPVHLTFMYPRWQPVDAETIGQFVPVAMVAVALLILLAGMKFLGRGAIVAMLALILCLLPALSFFNIAPMRYSFVADHYAYLASAALIALIIGACATAQRRLRPQAASRVGVAIGVSAVLLVVLGATSWARTGAFSNDLMIWRDTVRKNPGSYYARDRYATELDRRSVREAESDDEALKAQAEKDANEAMTQASMAASLNANDVEAEWIAGRLLRRKNDLDGAVQRLRRATSIDPTFVPALQDLAEALIVQKRYDEAIEKLNMALRVQSQSSRTHHILALAYLELDNIERAIAEDRLAVSIDPGDFGAREQLAELLAKTGKDKEALLEYTRVLEVQGTRADLWNKVGLLTVGHQNPTITEVQNAKVFFNQALALNPDDAEAKKNLAMLDGMLKAAQAAATTRAATQAATAAPVAPTSAP